MSINPADVEFSAFAGHGPGGQYRNRHHCCIRARHIPTGVVAIATSERSQLQNKRAALGLLAAKLAKLKEDEIKAAKAAYRASRPAPSFGSQYVRTYRLDGPDAGVVDHDTGTRWTLVDFQRRALAALLDLRARRATGAQSDPVPPSKNPKG